MNYQVGHLVYFEKDDPTFDDLKEAQIYAIEKSIDDSPYGIWTSQDEGSMLEAIVYGGVIYSQS